MIDESFWKRPAREVAEDLVGRVVSEFISVGDIPIYGMLTEVHAYGEPEGERGEELFTQEPGLIGNFSSRRGSIPTITAHEEGGSGLVRLNGLRRGNNDYSTLEISRLLESGRKSGLHVGQPSGLYIGETPFDLSTEGLTVVELKINPQDPKNLVVKYALRMV
jgi:hypothetical protein|tara:strand:- start:650 stop:1138 length:489 start_codon:yes stop_codon:yes gene_type:complete